jgi:hypothetical protein
MRQRVRDVQLAFELGAVRNITTDIALENRKSKE